MHWDDILIRLDERLPAKLLPERPAETVIQACAFRDPTCSGGEIEKFRTV